jgi:hypothetical protein
MSFTTFTLYGTRGSFFPAGDQRVVEGGTGLAASLAASRPRIGLVLICFTSWVTA